jgi:hypothetical protein
MSVLFFDVNEVLIDLGPQAKYLLDVNIFLENLLPELSSLQACLLDHFLKLDIDLLEFNDGFDLRLDLEAG